MFPGRLTRRQFLALAGAGLAGAALACNGSHVPVVEEQSSSSPRTAVPPTLPAVPAPSELAADKVFLGGRIITVDPSGTIAEALAIRDGRILTVGSDSEVSTTIGADTELVQLSGLSVTPGMIDAHNHFQVMGLMHGYYEPLLPPDVITIQDLQDQLKEIAAHTAKGAWIKGYFMFLQDVGLPTRHDLDPVSDDHPIWIVQQGGHYGSANSLALQMARITSETADPVGGMIGRDVDGSPDGIFYNHRAMDLVRRVVPVYTQEMVHENILTTQKLFASCGVTSFQDNNVRGVDTVQTYLDVARRGEMYLRGDVYYTLEWPGDIDRAVNDMKPYDDDFMRFAGYKFLLDGQLTMAYCHEPHNGERWDLPTWDPQTFREAVRVLHDTGYQICVHCAGDAAVDLTLDAFEAAMNANPRSDPRHRIEHGVITKASSTQRMKDLGVVVCTQPQFIRLGGDGYVDLFGEARARRAIPTREWLEAGVPVALSSDSPATPWYTPQATLIGAVTRATFSNTRLAPEQAMTIEEAIRAHTIGAAYAAHGEMLKGSLEPGKLADLVVWSADPYTASMQELWGATAEMTVIGGEIVHQTGVGLLTPQRARDLWG